MKKISLAPAAGNFPRIVVNAGEDLDEILSFAERTANDIGVPVHLQDSLEFTFQVVYPS